LDSPRVGVTVSLCFLVKGSQCSHPYVCTKCIPIIGTTIKARLKTPIPNGLLSVVAAICAALCARQDNPILLLIRFCALDPTNLHDKDMEQFLLDKKHQYITSYQQFSKTPRLLQSGQSVTDRH